MSAGHACKTDTRARRTCRQRHLETVHTDASAHRNTCAHRHTRADRHLCSTCAGTLWQGSAGLTGASRDDDVGDQREELGEDETGVDLVHGCLSFCSSARTASSRQSTESVEERAEEGGQMPARHRRIVRSPLDVRKNAKCPVPMAMLFNYDVPPLRSASRLCPPLISIIPATIFNWTELWPLQTG